MSATTTHFIDQSAVVLIAGAGAIGATTRKAAPPLKAQPASLRSLGRSLMVLALLAGAAGEARAERPLPIDPQAGPVENILSFRDWKGAWDLEWEYQGKWYGKVMELEATPTGITGDYVLGVLNGRFVQGDVARVSGEITNVTNTGSTCSSGRQGGFFSLNLARDGRTMEGWWDVCGEGRKWAWKAKKR